MSHRSNRRRELLAEFAELHPASPGPEPGSAQPTDQRLARALECLRAVVVEVGGDGRTLFVSSSVTSVLGYAPEDLVGGLAWDRVHDADLGELVAACRRLHATGEPVRARLRVRHKSGHWVPLWTRSCALAVGEGEARTLTFAREASELRASEEPAGPARQPEKPGLTPGQIAHDFNNLLTPILGDASLALMDLPRDSPQREALQRIQRAARRAAVLTRKVLAHTRDEAIRSKDAS